MRKLHTRRGGFTLIELMIVVAIIGILAAIAIPNFLRFQLRSKTGEAKTNLAAMRTAEEGYFAEYGIYVPRRPCCRRARRTPRSASGRSRPIGFDQLGWGPEGEVFFNYASTRAPARRVVHARRAGRPRRRRPHLGLRLRPPGSGATVGLARGVGTCAGDGRVQRRDRPCGQTC